MPRTSDELIALRKSYLRRRGVAMVATALAGLLLLAAGYIGPWVVIPVAAGVLLSFLAMRCPACGRFVRLLNAPECPRCGLDFRALAEAPLRLELGENTSLASGSGEPVAPPVEPAAGAATDAEQIQAVVEEILGSNKPLLLDLTEPEQAPDAVDAAARLREESLEELTSRLKHRSPWLLVVPSLIGLNLIVLVLMLIAGAHPFRPDPPVLLAWGANTGLRTFAGEPWRLLSAIFVHADVAHLTGAALALLAVGRTVERLFGSVVSLAVYLIAGVIGGLVSLAWDPLGIHAGSLAATFGLLGAQLAAFARSAMGRRASARYWAVAAPVVGFALYIASLSGQLDIASIMGGMATGFLLGLVLVRPLENMADRAPVVRLAVAGGVLGVSLLLAWGPLSKSALGAVETLQWLQNWATALTPELERTELEMESYPREPANTRNHLERLVPLWREIGARAQSLPWVYRISHSGFLEQLEIEGKMIETMSAIQATANADKVRELGMLAARRNRMLAAREH